MAQETGQAASKCEESQNIVILAHVFVHSIKKTSQRASTVNIGKPIRTLL